MRLIDADAMIDRLKEWDTKDKTDKALYNFTLNRINEQPTIQPAEPKRIRGQWSIKGQTIDTVRGYWATCSACGYAVFGGGNYCSNCGSYNKGEVTE